MNRNMKRIGIFLCLLFFYATSVHAQVTQQWVSRYNGPGNGVDQATAIAVDGFGNSYVTGRSWGGNTTGDDYATVAYAPNGTKLWEARYNGPGNGRDVATAIVLDGDNNVYVTGYSLGLTSTDYATVAYNANGVELWVARFSGPAGFDQATAIAFDGVGSVYVTGESFGGSATSYDYATVAYNVTNGAQLWVSRFNGPANSTDYPTAIALDGVGNVYVTGYSRNGDLTAGSDYATVAYNSDTGTQLWAARYQGPAGNGSDAASAIAVDSTGNVYVTGTSVGSGTGFDYLTVAYAANGRKLWEGRYNGPGNGEDRATAIAVDAGGNVYFTGSSYGGPAAGVEYATIATDSGGHLLWIARYGGPGLDSEATAIALDGVGGVYITGVSKSVGSAYDYATVAYNPVGTQMWAARYSGPSGGINFATGLVLDLDNNVLVTGYSDSGVNYDYATIKYSQP